MELTGQEKKCKRQGCDLPRFEDRALCFRHRNDMDSVGQKRQWPNFRFDGRIKPKGSSEEWE